MPAIRAGKTKFAFSLSAGKYKLVEHFSAQPWEHPGHETARSVLCPARKSPVEPSEHAAPDRWLFSGLRPRFIFAIAQRDLTLPGEIHGLAENPRSLLRRVEAR